MNKECSNVCFSYIGNVRDRHKLPLFSFFEAMEHELFIRRCFDLARLGAGSTSPNPMVGAVLVHDGRIIGEGWHQKHGGPHAEVNAIASVKKTDRRLISKSTLYVSLEPCCIHGRTPPCTNLILENNIPKVVISAIDLTPDVKGQGVSILRGAGVAVVTGVLKAEGEKLAAIRNTFVSQKRPYIILKWAQTADGLMGKPDEQAWISNPFSKHMAHRLRSEMDAILVGTKTAAVDNPRLDNRQWYGRSPLRILLDRKGIVPPTHFLFDQKQKTLVVTEEKVDGKGSLEFFQTKFDNLLLPNLMAHLFEKKISSLIVEGGAYTLHEFIEKKLWDEAWIFQSDQRWGTGIEAPKLRGGAHESGSISNDVLTIIHNSTPFR